MTTAEMCFLALVTGSFSLFAGVISLASREETRSRCRKFN